MLMLDFFFFSLNLELTRPGEEKRNKKGIPEKRKACAEARRWERPQCPRNHLSVCCLCAGCVWEGNGAQSQERGQGASSCQDTRLVNTYGHPYAWLRVAHNDNQMIGT